MTMQSDNATTTKARIEFTKEDRRGNPVRKAVEVDASKVDARIAKLVDQGAYSFDVRYEAR
jgi:hypothetical protein